MIKCVAFDADDTLWHNERHYTEAKEKFSRLLTRYHTAEWIDSRLDQTELQNLNRYGYGIKSFALSMIETAIQMTEGRITGSEINEIIALAWDMLGKPMQIFDGVVETIGALTGSYKIMLVTKGDLFEQEAKIARSGIGDYFNSVEIVSEKTPAAYQAILWRHRIEPHEFMMVGNSLKSDVLPVLKLGGRAVHIPFESTWVHEQVDDAELQGLNIVSIERITDLRALLGSMNGGLD